MSLVKIKVINQLKDNFSFILYNDSGDACVIDPAESAPIIKYVNNYNLKIKDIFITHHHKDHTNGVEGLIKNFSKINIYSPSNYIENTKFILHNNDEVNSSINSFKIFSTPGHTLDHIVYYDSFNRILFSGDCLFRLGCGRVFEGTLDQMYNSLQKINELNNDIMIFCGHEYTIKNLSFLEVTLDKKNLYSSMRRKIETDIGLNGRSIPFLLDDEKSYNLFLNQESKIGMQVKKELKLDNYELFKYLRNEKDKF